MMMVRPSRQELPEQVLQHGDGAVVERGEGFVEQQQGRIMQERAGHRQPLAHAARELAHQAVRTRSRPVRSSHSVGGLTRARATP